MYFAEKHRDGGLTVTCQKPKGKLQGGVFHHHQQQPTVKRYGREREQDRLPLKRSIAESNRWASDLDRYEEAHSRSVGFRIEEP